MKHGRDHRPLNPEWQDQLDQTIVVWTRRGWSHLVLVRVSSVSIRGKTLLDEFRWACRALGCLVYATDS